MGCNCGKNKRPEPPRTTSSTSPQSGKAASTPTPAAPPATGGSQNG